MTQNWIKINTTKNEDDLNFQKNIQKIFNGYVHVEYIIVLKFIYDM